MITISGMNLLISDQIETEAISPDELEGWTLIGRDEFMTVTGQFDSTGFGTSIEMGDLDGDGRDDIVAGVPTYTGNGGTGAVLIYFARDLEDIHPLRAVEDADVILYGEESGDRFGSNIALGDMNGDGRDELLVAAPWAFGWEGERRWSGEVYILAGRERSEYPSTMFVGKVGLYGHIYGRDAMDQIGLRMTLGDLTGDNLDDLVLGTNGAGGFGGTNEFPAGFENNAPGSWEIEVIEGKMSSIGNLLLDRDIKMVRYFSSWNSTETPPDTHAKEIGTGMDVSDFDGDGIGDLIFSWSRWVGALDTEKPVSTQIEIISGGPDFPHVPVNTTIDIIIPSFEPNMTIQLNNTITEPPILTGGDLDGDQYMDLVIGAPMAYDSTGRMPDAGQVWIMKGFDHSEGETVFSSGFESTIYGQDASDGAGSSLLVSDIDDDGLDDILIGAPGADGKGNLLPDCGEGYLFEMDGTFTEELEAYQANVSYMGYFEGVGSFSSMASGDINMDGILELLVSSPGYMSPDGADELGLLSMFMSKQNFEARIYGGVDSGDFGRSVISADFNKDGYPDIVVGDPLAYKAQDGGAYLFFGGPEGWDQIINLDFDADIVFKVGLEGNQAHLGTVMASGDLDDDGYPDLVIGAPNYYDGLNNCGSFDIYWGGNETYMREKNHKQVLGQSVEMVGQAIAVGDYNGDGTDDLAVSAPATTSTQSLGRYHAGNVFIYFGPLSTSGSERISSADVKITGSIAREQIGMSLASGDIDNDGTDELFIGAPDSALGSIKDQGAVYMMKGRDPWSSEYDLSTDDPVRILGPWPYDQVGDTLATGDLDGDGSDDLVIGSSSGDGFQRSAVEAGNVYVLFSGHLSNLPDGTNISLRDGYNMTVFGEREMERFGSSLGIGDMDGDGSNDLAIGAKGWIEPLSETESGCVKIIPSRMIRDGGLLNSSSLSLISSKTGVDLFGASIFTGNISGDGNDDLLVGAPGFDPFGTGEIRGGVFLWEGKEVHSRDLKVSTARMIGADPVEDPEGILTEIYYLSPRAGPYTLRVTGRSIFGYDDIRSISVTMGTLEGPGQTSMVFNTTMEAFDLFTTGVFTNNIWIDPSNCSGTSDRVESWYVDFVFDVDWDMPDPDVITTTIQGNSESHTNYLSREFRIDRTIHIDDEGMDINDGDGGMIEGWQNATSTMAVSNITLSHVMNGERIDGVALEDISLGLYRPDGILIGRTVLNGSTLEFPTTVPGEGLDEAGAAFTIAPLQDDPLPTGSRWQRNLSFEIDMDTSAPAEVTSFVIYPDGKENGIGELDDDRFIELGWIDIADQGPSGIERYILDVVSEEGNTTYGSVRPGNLIMIPEGEVYLTLHALDRAGNHGPSITRHMLSDTGIPIFMSPSPSDGSWLNGDQEELSIIALDTVSGLDVASGSYRLFYPGSNVLSEWKQVMGFVVGENDTRLVAPVPGEEGYGIYVQWKVSDLAGGTLVSEPYTFNIDLTPPTIDTDDQTIITGPGSFEVSCFMEDPLSWLNLTSVQYRVASAGTFDSSEWIDLGMDGYRVSASPSTVLDPGFEGTGFLQWRVSDRAGNMVESDLITLEIDRTLPVFGEFTPNSTDVQSERTVDVSVVIVEEGSGIGPGDVEVSVSTISGWVQYGVGGFSPWEEVDTLEDFNGQYTAEAKVDLDEGRFNLIRFRVMDLAGNGWVISSSYSVEIQLPVVNLPPTALFNVVPVSDMIFKGDSLILDGSPSLDPEGANLNYSWYSDLEDYPGSGFLGKGKEINITLTALGVHNIWLVVTDGVNTVESEQVKIRVVDTETVAEEEEGDGNDDTLCDRIRENILFLLLALLMGIIIGAVIIYFGFMRRLEPEPMIEKPEFVDAMYEDDYIVPHCPYCGEEARATDDYCIKCGSVFTEKDKREMIEGGGKSKKKKKKRSSLKAADEDEEEDLYGDVEYEPPVYEDDTDLESDFFSGTPREEEMDYEEIDEDDLEEIDEEDLEELDIEEVEEIEDEDLDWEVEE